MGLAWLDFCSRQGWNWSRFRPDRKARRWQGKSDPVDAEAAARAAQAGRASGVPKTRGGKVDALRALRVARRSAVAARADAQRQIKALIVTAPDALRTTLRGLGNRKLIAQCATRRPDRAAAGDPAVATTHALRVLARRHQQLSVEIDELDALIGPLVTAINPTLIGLSGVGTDVAGQLLVTAGDNPQRLRSEAAFAMLCGAAPLPASSGRTHRHRLNRGGDRQANAALYRVVLCRLRWDPRTRAYAQRRTTRRHVQARDHPLPQALMGRQGEVESYSSARPVSLRCRRERSTSFPACRSRPGGAQPVRPPGRDGHADRRWASWFEPPAGSSLTRAASFELSRRRSACGLLGSRTAGGMSGLEPCH